MSTRRTTSSLALGATAALLVSAVSTVVASSPATAADALPAGSTLVVQGLGTAARPGEAQTATLLLTAPDNSVDTNPSTPAIDGDANSDRDPLVDQVVTVSLDHGYVTSGVSTVNATAGALPVRTTPIKTDGNGAASFAVSITRDGGFDDDGRVTSVVTAAVGAVSGQRTATWGSADPLNGGSVDVVLSPAARQEAPVAPAVSGDRTYYDVVTRDQFGNPVAGETVDLDLERFGRPTDFDYSEDSVVSDLLLNGDFWVTSFVPADLAVPAVWTAPTSTYSNTTGATTRGATTTVEGTATASFYDVSFAGSTYQLAPSAAGEQPVGSTLTQTVTVTDQRGRPVRGLDVQFFRFGPALGNAGEKQVDRITNARGQASYSFVGTDPGVAKVTAVVSDGVSSRTLASEVGFKHVTTVSVAEVKAKAKKVKGKKAQGAKVDPAADDVLEVSSQKVAAGARVTVFRVKGTARKAVGPRDVKLDKSGSATIEVPDKNKKKPTSYVVVIAPTTISFGATSVAAARTR